MNEEDYACGNIKGTVYGPAEFLSKHQKRFRRMNLQEYDSYMDKVEETEGFDVDGCSGYISGGIAPLPPSCYDWKYAVHASKFAALEQAGNGGKPIDFVRLVKANTQAVGGVIYYLTIIAIDTTDRMEKTYKAKVFARPGKGKMELMFFEDVFSKVRRTFDEERPKKVGRGKKRIAKVEDMQPSLGTVSRFLFDDMREKITIECPYVKPPPGQHLRDAFWFYVKELKRRNSQWTHAKARSAASKTWKSLRYPAKAPFYEQSRSARNKFKKKHLHLFPDFKE